MAKYIKVPEADIARIRQEFEAEIGKAKFADGKISFSRSIGSVTRRAKLFFTERAYLKMLLLVQESDKEVGWHGIARRGEDPEKDEYVVSDIMVYPQEVTSATIKPDPKEYSDWLGGLSDEVFDDLKFHGHSHVNFGTSPSVTDTEFYTGILEQPFTDQFYIFLIINKKGEHTVKIYDIAKNVLFETADVSIEVIAEDGGIMEYVKQAKTLVREKSWQSKTSYYPSYSGYSGGYPGGYSGKYSSDYYANFRSSKPVLVDSVKPTETKTPSAPEKTVKTEQKQTVTPKKRKGRRKDKTSRKYQSSYGISEFDPDDDFPYDLP